MNQAETMTKIEEYLFQNRKVFRNEYSRETIAELPENEFNAIFEAARHVSEGAEARPGISCSVLKSDLTLADYDYLSICHWHRLGKRTELKIGDYPAVMYRGVQLCKGCKVHNIIVVNFGEYRVVLM